MTLDVLAVEHFTQGRLAANDPATQQQLDAALTAARRYCGWHVVPAREETILVDGPGGQTLTLPTLNVETVTEVIECGVTIDPTELTWSAKGMLVKRSGERWTHEFRGIEITFTHGFDDAADFEGMVLKAIDRGGFSTELGLVAIGPFKYGGGTSSDVAAPSAFTLQERSTLDLYALEKPA
jgi:hypothetical protein